MIGAGTFQMTTGVVAVTFRKTVVNDGLIVRVVGSKGDRERLVVARAQKVPATGE